MKIAEAIELLVQLRCCVGSEKYKEMYDLAITAMKDLEVCRNELCLRCGQYKQRHLGACDGCRWYEPPKEEQT